MKVKRTEVGSTLTENPKSIPTRVRVRIKARSSCLHRGVTGQNIPPDGLYPGLKGPRRV